MEQEIIRPIVREELNSNTNLENHTLEDLDIDMSTNIETIDDLCDPVPEFMLDEPHQFAPNKLVDDDDGLDRISMNKVWMTAQPTIPVIAPIILDELPKFYYMNSDKNSDKTKKVFSSTNLLCWTCCSTITEAWQLPISTEKLAIDDTDHVTNLEIDLSIKELIDSDKSKHKKVKQVRAMRVEGVFCHVPCMGRYCTFPDVVKRINIWQTKTLIRDMFKDKTGCDLTNIPISEAPSIMAKFCGPSGITEKAYYEKNIAMMKTYITSFSQ